MPRETKELVTDTTKSDSDYEPLSTEYRSGCPLRQKLFIC